MLFNDVIDLLMHVPPMLAGAWAVWFSFGLMLSIWQRREKARLIVHGAAPRHRSAVRPASGIRPPSGFRAPRPVAPRPPAANGGDAFSELEALLEAPEGSHRRPGEAPRLPAPQSLP